MADLDMQQNQIRSAIKSHYLLKSVKRQLSFACLIDDK